MSASAPIICLCHLLWERTLFQRPQQIMTQLAKRGHDVLFLSHLSSKRWLGEFLRGQAGKHRSAPGENPAFRNLPWIPLTSTFPFLQTWERRSTVNRIKRWLGSRADEAILWIYHPDNLPLLDMIPHRTLVYDVMDHFPAFKQSRSDVKSKEDFLLERADVVFTGGVALQEATVGRRPNAHCYSSGIDVDHFAKARDPQTEIPEEIRDLPRPILGYFGAVDERLDFGLMKQVCKARPDWSIVLIGPQIPGTEINVDEPNFHWLGGKPYAQLPNFIRGFDVCIMPWVQSELTAHISPTKTPEYLAGGKPVVSIPIRDVVRNYGDIVFFGDNAETFIEATEKALAAADRDWAATIVDHPHALTWSRIAQEMDDLIARNRAG